MGRITPIMNYIRKVLIEAVYGRLSKTFSLHIRRTDTDSVGKALCSPIHKARGPVPMSRPPTFHYRFVPLTRL